jgi:hypothetical protein
VGRAAWRGLGSCFQCCCYPERCSWMHALVEARLLGACCVLSRVASSGSAISAASGRLEGGLWTLQIWSRAFDDENPLVLTSPGAHHECEIFGSPSPCCTATHPLSCGSIYDTTGSMTSHFLTWLMSVKRAGVDKNLAPSAGKLFVRSLKCRLSFCDKICCNVFRCCSNIEVRMCTGCRSDHIMIWLGDFTLSCHNTGKLTC